MTEYKVAEVRWIDASISSSDFDRKSAQNTKPVDRWTIGYLIEETEDCVVLATDYYVKKKKEEFAGKLVIPWGIVTEYYIYR